MAGPGQAAETSKAMHSNGPDTVEKQHSFVAVLGDVIGGRGWPATTGATNLSTAAPTRRRRRGRPAEIRAKLHDVIMAGKDYRRVLKVEIP